MTDTNKLLGLRIKRLRETYGHTQSELATRTNLSLKHVGELERGRGNPSLKSIQRLAAVLEVSLSELFDFGDEDKPDDVLREEIMQRLQTASPEVVRLVHKALKQ